jgi:hypothetical protein
MRAPFHGPGHSGPVEVPSAQLRIFAHGKDAA